MIVKNIKIADVDEECNIRVYKLMHMNQLMNPS